MEAGVDAIFLVGVPSRSVLEAISTEIEVPILLGGGAGEMRDPKWLAGQGVRFLLRGHQTFSASVQSIYTTMRSLRDGVEPEEVEGMATEELMKAVTRTGEYDRERKDWL